MRDNGGGERGPSERMVVLSVQEQERQRIARDLHDLIGQRLTALRLKIELLKWAAPAELADRVEEALQLTDRIDQEVDFFAWEWRASALDEQGLVGALSALVIEWSRTYHIPATFQTNGLGTRRLTRAIENSLYRITQEALTNVFKHAEAHQVSVTLEAAPGEVTVLVQDDGRGFDQSESSPASTSNRSMGLIGMRERAVLAGGTVSIESAPGSGTAVIATVPAAFADDLPVERRLGLRDRRDPARA